MFTADMLETVFSWSQAPLLLEARYLDFASPGNVFLSEMERITLLVKCSGGPNGPAGFTQAQKGKLI